jgi:hypothetical protein
MMVDTRALRRARLSALDGPVGRVVEVYFDSRRWRMRHLVVRCGLPWARRRVLIDPQALRAAMPPYLALNLTRAQVLHAPGPEHHRPQSRRDDAAYPYFTPGSGAWGVLDAPLGASVAPAVPLATHSAMAEPGDESLCSSADLIGLRLHASDGRAGRVADFVFDALDWQLRYVVADIGGLWHTQPVLMPARWVTQFDWSTRTVQLQVPRAAVAACTPYQPGGAPMPALSAGHA